MTDGPFGVKVDGPVVHMDRGQEAAVRRLYGMPPLPQLEQEERELSEREKAPPEKAGSGE
jgi:hypothetical protein